MDGGGEFTHGKAGEEKGVVEIRSSEARTELTWLTKYQA